MTSNHDYFRETYPELYDQLVGLRTHDDDLNIRFKQIVKQKLIADPRIIHVLHNDELDESQPDDYLGVNILSRVNLPEVQAKVKNYICFKVDLIEDLDYNTRKARVQVTFQILCRDSDIVTEFGIDRHDLLGYLLKDAFHMTDTFWTQCRCVFDQETLTDSHYNGRLIKFELTVPNNMVETRNGVQRNRNNGVSS